MKCIYPGCTGIGNTNRISATHRKLQFCPLAKTEKGAAKLKKTRTKDQKENDIDRGNYYDLYCFQFVILEQSVSC